MKKNKKDFFKESLKISERKKKIVRILIFFIIILVFINGIIFFLIKNLNEEKKDIKLTPPKISKINSTNPNIEYNEKEELKKLMKELKIENIKKQQNLKYNKTIKNTTDSLKIIENLKDIDYLITKIKKNNKDVLLFRYKEFNITNVKLNQKTNELEIIINYNDKIPNNTFLMEITLEKPLDNKINTVKIISNNILLHEEKI